MSTKNDIQQEKLKNTLQDFIDRIEYDAQGLPLGLQLCARYKLDMSNLTFLFLPTWSTSILDDKFVVFLRFVWAHSVEYLFLVSLSSRYFT